MRRLLITLITLFCACQCSSPLENKKNCARINIVDEPQSLDPRKARDLSSVTLTRMLFEGLTRLNKEEKAEPALAARIEISEDLKVYTFYLHPSTWNNGDSLTAKDFVYAWKKVLDPQFASENAFQMYVIKNAKAVKQGAMSADALGVHIQDELTLRIELESPFSSFLELLALPVFFPIHAAQDSACPEWSGEADTIISNGPFTLKEWNHSSSLKAEKNEAYWDAKNVHLKDIEMVMVKVDTELMMYEKNELDWAGSPLSSLPFDALISLKKERQLKVKPFLATYFLRTNTQKAPLDHPLLRKAFALAVSRKQIIEHVIQGDQIPATGIVPASMGLSEEPYFKDGDTESAKKLFQQVLEEVKLSREGLPPITLMYVSSERNHLIAQTLQQQWFDVFGVLVALEGIERKVYYDRLSKHDYQLASSSWTADFNDPCNFLEAFKFRQGSSNNTAWEDPRYIELLDQASKASNSELRFSLLRQSEKLLIDEMPIIPIYHFTMLYMNPERIKDVVLSSMGSIDFKWASINEKGEMR